MIINDPRGPGTIDVTGWELDRLAGVVGEAEYDRQHGDDRELTDDELDALTGDGLLGEAPAIGWHLHDEPVTDAIVYLALILAEAIFQRDLPAALDAKANGRELTIGQSLIYASYVEAIAAP